MGLEGELRTVSQLEKRLTEAAKLGFTNAIVPKSALRGVKIPDSITVFGAENISQALSMAKKAALQ